MTDALIIQEIYLRDEGRWLVEVEAARWTVAGGIVVRMVDRMTGRAWTA